MKKIIITTLALLLAAAELFAANPVQPETVYSFVKQKKSLEWYKEQQAAWRGVIDKETKNAAGWLNYYTATRMIKLMGGELKQGDLNKVVDEIAAAIPNSFEHHYVTYWNGNNDPKLFHHIEKAHQLAPNRPETYDELFTYYELEGEKDMAHTIAVNWFGTNDISANIYAWNYNMLNSTDEQAILITAGDNDTYPARILQEAQQVRRDVAVINLSLLLRKDYQDRVFREIGVTPMTQGIEAFGNVKKYQEEICKHLMEGTRPVYFSPGINHHIYDTFKDDLYNVGLAYKWSEHKFDNIAVTKKNFEKRYLKDYLKTELFTDLSETVNDRMNASYLMPLLTLHNHYKEGDEKEQLKEVEDLAVKIAKKSGRESDIAEIMGERTSNVISLVITDPRKALNGFLKINDTLHVQQRETDNGLYNRFLLDLLKQRRYDDLNIAKSGDVNWMKILDSKYDDMPYDKVFEHGKPEGDFFPVVNVSYEGALLYCEWLTDVYNKLDHKRKKYKRVTFRLPTEKEWEYLARSGKPASDRAYSWGRPYVRNSRGCFLGNINAKKEDRWTGNDPMAPAEAKARALKHQAEQLKAEAKKTCPAFKSSNFDGGIFPVKTASYMPNDYGLYCITGNVSEMVAEKGIAKGGSWDTVAEDATIDKQQTYEKRDPRVGFRVIMTVEETK